MEKKMNKRQTEPYISRYLHQLGSRKGLPVSGNFELTARCNFNCPMCYIHLGEKAEDGLSGELSAEEWVALAGEAKNAGMVFALLTGGEPFIRKDFFEIYHKIKEMGIMVSINSNGSMIRGRILEELKKDPPSRINISLYGGCRETYRSMCGQDMYDTVVENILGIKKAGIDVRLNLSITPYNYQDLDKIYKVSRELGVHVKSSAYMYPAVRINGEQYGAGNRLTPEEAAQYQLYWDRLRLTNEEYETKMKAASRFDSLDNNECSMDLDEGVRCRAGHSSFWISWEGKMLPCGMMPYPAADTIRDGFQKSWKQTKEAVDKIRLPGKCANCPKRRLCGVCASVCVAETGFFDQVPEYMCRQTDRIIQLAGEHLRDKE